MKSMKKLLAVVIVLAMTLAIIPAFPAYAEGETENDKLVLVGEGQAYETLAALFDTAKGGKTVEELNGYTIKMVSDISESNVNINLKSTKSFSLTIDGDGHTLTMINPFVVSSLSGTNEAIVSGVTASVHMKNINAVKAAGTDNDHPLVFVRAGAKVVVENCSVSDDFNYAFGLSKFDGELTVKSGTYYSKKAVFRSNYQSTAQTSLIVDGGYYELVNDTANEGLIDPVKVGTNTAETNLKVTINGGTFKTNGAVMFPLKGTVDVTVNGGKFLSVGATMFECLGTTNNILISNGDFVVNGEAEGEMMFDTRGESDITVKGGRFVADKAITTYLGFNNVSNKMTVTGGIFWQNVRYPIIMERAKTCEVTVSGGIFYTPDYRLYDGDPSTEPDDLIGQLENDNTIKAPNTNTMYPIDGVHDYGTKNSDWKCLIDGAKFYYTVSENVGIVATVDGKEIYATPVTYDTNAVAKLQHSTMCGKTAQLITPETVAEDAQFANLYVTEDVTIPVVLDANLNNPAFEGAYLTLTEDYTGESLELTQAVTVNKNGFNADGITASDAASVRQDLDGAKVYVQYSGKDGDGKVTARLVVGIDSLDYKNVGIKVTANAGVAAESLEAYAAEAEKVKTFSINNCYGSLIADGRAVSAIEYGGNYFIAVEITGITQDVVVRFNAYATVDGEVTQTGVQEITLKYPA